MCGLKICVHTYMHNWTIYYHMWVYTPTHWLPIKSRMAAKIREMFAISWQPERRSVKTMFLTATTALYFCMALLRKTSGIHHPCGAAHQQILLGTGLSLSRPVLFGAPLFENHVSLILTTYCLVFLEACLKVDHITYFGSMATDLSLSKCLKVIFQQSLKPKTL